MRTLACPEHTRQLDDKGAAFPRQVVYPEFAADCLDGARGDRLPTAWHGRCIELGGAPRSARATNHGDDTCLHHSNNA